jgi:DNA-binding SARP family transcriptional activator/tetratricopeptide (TPR) repeat protein
VGLGYIIARHYHFKAKIVQARPHVANGAEQKQTPALLQIRLLGGFQLERRGQPIPETTWERRAAKTLIKLLAVTSGHLLHREQVLEILWPDVPLDSAYGTFRKALHVARHALQPELGPREPSRYLRQSDEVLALDPEWVWIDADHFEALAKVALHSREVGAFEAALAAYSGELLPEDRYEDWAAARREALGEQHLHLLMGLADLLEQRRAYGPAAERWRQVLVVDPVREEVHRRLMRLYAQVGNRHAALRQYQLCREVLRTELGVEPEEETEALHRELLARCRPEEIAVADLSASEDHSPLSLPPAIRRLPSIPLVGREHILDLVRSQLAHASNGSGGLILVGGEAGVGKTRLVAEVASEAQRQGVLVLWGASYEQEGQIPYGLFVEATEDYLLTRPLTERKALAHAYPELGALFPSLTSDTVKLGAEQLLMEDAPSKQQLFAAYARLLDALSAVYPLLLVLDDLHTADGASLQLLHYLARLAPERRWFMLGTYREEDVKPGSGFQHLSIALTRTELCRRVDLGRLSRADCDQLVRVLLDAIAQQGDWHVDTALLTYVYALSIGNPFFVLQLVRTMHERGWLTIIDGSWQVHADDRAPIPARVRDLVQAHLQNLQPDTQRILSLAAVVGADFSFAVLHQAATVVFRESMDELKLLDVLDEALQARILEDRAGASGTDYAFRHPLYRTTIYEALSTRHRVHLHEIVARAIEQLQPKDVEALAYHYSQSEECTKAAFYLERAGDRARSLQASDVAVEYYQRALPLLALAGQVRIMLKLTDIWELMGEWEQAETTCRQATEIATSLGDTQLMAQCQAGVGYVLWLKGRFEESVPWLEEALASFEQVEDRVGAARVTAYMGLIYWQKADYAQALAYFDRHLRMAGDTGNQFDVDRGIGHIGLVYLDMGDYARALSCFQEQLQIATSIEDKRGMSLALGNMGEAYFCQGDYTRALCNYQQCLEIGALLGDRQGVGFFIGSMGRVYAARGEWERARTCFERAWQILDEIGDRRHAAIVMGRLAHTCAAQGDSTRAEPLYRQALSRLQEVDSPYDVCENLYHYAHLLASQARYAEAQPLNGEALRIATNVGRADIALATQILAITLREALSKIDVTVAVRELENLLSAQLQDREQAMLLYEIWTRDKRRVDRRDTAARLYRDLYTQTPNVDYYQRHRELTGMDLPVAPSLPELPQIVIGDEAVTLQAAERMDRTMLEL